MSTRRFVFLDRDGTLLHDPGYLHRISDYRVLPGTVEGLRLLQQAGFGLAVVTNQSGIGRGYYSEQEFHDFQAHFTADLAAQEVRIEASYFCPHLPDAGCPCRKPATALLERAREELGAELERSFMVGDTPEDMELARRVGCRGVYVLTGRGEERLSSLDPDVPVTRNCLAAAHHILGSEREPS